MALWDGSTPIDEVELLLHFSFEVFENLVETVDPKAKLRPSDWTDVETRASQPIKWCRPALQAVRPIQEEPPTQKNSAEIYGQRESQRS